MLKRELCRRCSTATEIYLVGTCDGAYRYAVNEIQKAAPMSFALGFTIGPHQIPGGWYTASDEYT